MNDQTKLGTERTPDDHSVPNFVSAGREPRQFPQMRFSRPPGATELVLVRHGQSQAMVEGEPFPMTDGQGDPPLSELGRWQAERVGERLAREPMTAIYVSSMVRTHQTAAPLAARCGISPVVDRDLREVHLGEWEAGLLRRMAVEEHPTYLQMHAEERWELIPGAESNEQFSGRVLAAVERIAADHPDEQVAVFVHGGVIGALLSHAARSRRFAFNGADNGSISQLVISGDRWLVRRFNDSSHLYDTLSTAVDHMT